MLIKVSQPNWSTFSRTFVLQNFSVQSEIFQALRYVNGAILYKLDARQICIQDSVTYLFMIEK